MTPEDKKSKKRYIIYLRHGEDRPSKHLYDEKLTEEGKAAAQLLAKELIETYGVPDAIYCSPFYRTRQTRKEMLKTIGTITDKKIVKVSDPRLSRYFTSYQAENPDIRSDTWKHNVPIYESWHQFKKRVKKQLKHMEQKEEYQVIWCIGHTLIVKYIARFREIERSDYIDYLDKVVIEI